MTPPLALFGAKPEQSTPTPRAAKITEKGEGQDGGMTLPPFTCFFVPQMSQSRRPVQINSFTTWDSKGSAEGKMPGWQAPSSPL